MQTILCLFTRIPSDPILCNKASFWNVSRVARFNPATRAISFLQLGVYITFDLSTRSATLIAVLRGKDPVIVPCWHSPRAGDDPFEVLSPIFKSVVQSWALYFQTHDAVLSASVSHNNGCLLR
jgi:hypothetical protein